MLTFQDAVKQAMEFYNSLPLAKKPTELLVEELTYSKEEQYYLVTLGYTVAVTMSGINPLSAAMGVANTEYKREYKVFKVDAQTGEVLFMKIKKL